MLGGAERYQILLPAPPLARGGSEQVSASEHRLFFCSLQNFLCLPVRNEAGSVEFVSQPLFTRRRAFPGRPRSLAPGAERQGGLAPAHYLSVLELFGLFLRA